MKIILLGAQGMLGSDLAKIFSDQNIIPLDRAELDITDKKMVMKKIQVENPDIIINAAAYTAVDSAELNSTEAFTVNESAVSYIAQAAKAIDATVVHFSTDYVFQKMEGITEETMGMWTKAGQFRGFPENYPPGPSVNLYGKSKLAGEKALAAIAPKYYLVRTAWLYGSNGKNFVDTMLSLAESKATLPKHDRFVRVVDDQYGNPTYTKDLALATRELLLGGYKPAIYHLVNGGAVTWRIFAEKIFALAGRDVMVKPITSTEFPLPARRPKWSILQNTHGPLLRSWEEALQDYLRSRQNLAAT